MNAPAVACHPGARCPAKRLERRMAARCRLGCRRHAVAVDELRRVAWKRLNIISRQEMKARQDTDDDSDAGAEDEGDDRAD